MKKVIIIGATSGIGKALAIEYAKRGWMVGITGRRLELLIELSNLFPGKYYVKSFDICLLEPAMESLRELIFEMGQVDLIIMNAGTGHVNHTLEWATETNCITTNVQGFAAMCNVAMQYFMERENGHFAAVSSIAGVRGIGGAPAYSASKAFMINYLESLRGIVTRKKLNITISNIQPGFIDTAMGQNPKAFWRASTQKAARQIVEGLNRKKTQIYVTRRWKIIAWIMKWLPDWIVNKIG